MVGQGHNSRGIELNYIHFILFTVLSNAAAQIMLKYGMSTHVQLEMASPVTFSAIVMTVFKVLFNPWIFTGFLLFVVSMASHLYVLTKVDLSFAFPFLSLAYVVIAVFTWLVFKEDLNSWRIFGIGLIVVGTIFIAQGPASTHRDEPGTTHSNEKPQQVASLAGE